MGYKLAIFDFDGTLADSFPFFVGAFNAMAIKHGFKQIDPADAPGLRHLDTREMMRHVGLPAWKLPVVARSFMGLMKEKAATVSLFAGAIEVLQCLHNGGVQLAMVTSNSHENVLQIMGTETAGLFRDFECGMSMFGKQSGIKKVLKRSGVLNAEAIYIGDQVSDLEGARKANVAFGAVSWGYGSIESLRLKAPDHEYTEISDLAGLVTL